MQRKGRETDREETLAKLSAGMPALAWRKLVADTETPVGAALKLFEDGRGDFILESVEGGDTRGRYSLIGLDPDLVFRAGAETCAINRRWKNDREAFEDLGHDSLGELRALVESCRIDVPEELPAALACVVGYFGYETIGLVEKLPRAPQSELDLPDMLFVRPSVLLVFDSLGDELFCIAPIWPEDGGLDPARALETAHDRIDETLRKLTAPVPATPLLADLPEPVQTAVMAPGEYEAMVDRAKQYIEAGDIFQVVLAQRFTCEFPLPPLALYRALRRVNPSPFLYFLDLPGFAVIGSSPEILVRVREGEVTIRPIAGTRPRGKTAQEDKANEISLLDDPKERAEHLMLLDLGRNDVGRVAAPGTVEVTDSYTIERYSHVMHIVSNVVGRLDTLTHDAIDAVFAGFPAGTVSGAPKVRACQIIAELEPETRGAYAGGVGYFSPDGSVDSCIVLRTGVLKDGVLHVQAGAGIVMDSDPTSEQNECLHKSGALFAAAREAIRVAGEPGFGQ
ncbi:anthranilate synthase component I [Novosphingobium sp. YJ-S2-02]|uniref:Anthranilate synthase component 1 n=1 Tax=Novosphingobium aureum TaxID=2792964 RepID=A0A931HCV4_9SPHN|nr:anthranilate synthase component I [Novosphingobium aureum]MBH0113464.1 anthranilate synthase component I [Novosphingobium aureum]